MQSYTNKGRSPRDKTVKIGVRFANGQVSKWTYTADQLRWTLTGDDWDIAEYWRAE